MLGAKSEASLDYDLNIAQKNAKLYDNIAKQSQCKRTMLMSTLSEYGLNKVRDTHLALLSAYIDGSRALEVGCGSGRLAQELSKHAREFYGFDISFESVKRARRCSYSGLPSDSANNLFFVGNTLSLPFSDGFFDVIACSQVLEHVPNTAGALAEMWRVLKRKGIVSISVPNAAVVFYPLEFFSIIRHHGLRRLQALLSRQSDWASGEAYDRPFLPRQFVRLIKQSGFRILKFKTVLFYLWRRPYSDFITWLDQRRLIVPDVFIHWYSRLDRLLIESGLPMLRNLGTRQFILAVKDEKKN